MRSRSGEELGEASGHPGSYYTEQVSGAVEITTIRAIASPERTEISAAFQFKINDSTWNLVSSTFSAVMLLGSVGENETYPFSACRR